MSRADAPGFLSNPSFRAHLLWVVTGTTAALLVVTSAAILLPLFLRFEGSPATPEELGQLSDRILALHETLWPVVIMCLFAVMISSWILYQRMVSPLVRFVQVFDAVRSGRLPGPVRLRGGDYLTTEADALNAMVAALRDQQQALGSARAGLAEAVDELAEWVAVHREGDAAEVLARLQEREKVLAAQIGRMALD